MREFDSPQSRKVPDSGMLTASKGIKKLMTTRPKISSRKRKCSQESANAVNMAITMPISTVATATIVELSIAVPKLPEMQLGWSQ